MTFTVPALLIAGLLTFFSPCVLPLIPIYLATLAGTSVAAIREGVPARRLFWVTVAFSMGIMLVFVALGLTASQVGRVLSGHRVLVMQLSGLAIFLAGLKLLGFLRIPGLDREARPWLARIKQSGGLLWPFLFGAAFGLGWSPCIGPILASVLAFASTAESASKAVFYLATYAFGLTLPLIVVSLMAPYALRILDRAKRRLHTFELMSGVLLVGIGILFMTGNQQIILGGTGTVTAPAATATSIAATEGPLACRSGVSVTEEQASTTLHTEQQRGPLLIEFISASCPVCKRMHPVVETAKQNCSRHGIRIQQVDVSTEQGRQAAATNGILGVPTFLFINREGNEVARLVGQQPLETMVQSLEILAGQKCDGFRPLGS